MYLKGYEEDEDCYADIMKDDIIKLDDSSLIENVRPLQVATTKAISGMKYKQAADPANPPQGTAKRRLRLRRQRMEYYPNKQSGMFKIETREIPIQDALDSHNEMRNESMLNKFYVRRIKVRSVLAFLVILILSVLYLLVRFQRLWLGLNLRVK